MSTAHLLGTLAVTLFFCLAFLRGRHLPLLGKIGHRTVVSVAGGAAVAYVFMDLLPELGEAALGFREATSHLGTRLLDYGIHAATMAGFLFFYGLEELVIRSRDEEERRRRREAGRAHPLFRIHMIAFATYAWIVSYLMVGSAQQTARSLAFYAVAMALHFLSVAHALHEEHGARYDRIGAPLLVAFSATGWACGLAVELPEPVCGVLLGVVAGGIIANTTISELPREKEGKFVPFLVGAVAYTGLLFLAR